MPHFISLILIMLISFLSCGTSNSKSYRIGLDPTWNSLGALPQAATLKGFSIELISEIAKREKINLAIYDVATLNLISSLKDRECDAILMKMTPYIFYKKKFTFSDIYIQTGPVMVTSKSTHVPSSFAKREVALTSSAFERVVMKKYPEAILRFYSSSAQALNDLAAQTVDGAVLDLLTATAFCQDLFQGVLEVHLPPLIDEGLRAIGLINQSEELIEAFNRGFKKVREDGTYAQIAKKWGIGSSAISM